MTERPRFFDDLAGVAGGAFSALSGLRDEAESTIRARVDEAIRKFDLVKREDLEAVQEMAATARTGQEAAELRLAVLEGKVAALVARMDQAVEPVPTQFAGLGAGSGTGPDIGPGVVAGGAAFPPVAMPGGHGEGSGPVVPPSIT